MLLVQNMYCLCREELNGYWHASKAYRPAEVQSWSLEYPRDHSGGFNKQPRRYRLMSANWPELPIPLLKGNRQRPICNEKSTKMRG